MPEHAGTDGAAALGRMAVEEVLKQALDGGAADVFPPPEAASVDPAVVGGEDGAAEGLGGATAGQDAGESLKVWPQSRQWNLRDSKGCGFSDWDRTFLYRQTLKPVLEDPACRSGVPDGGRSVAR